MKCDSCVNYKAEEVTQVNNKQVDIRIVVLQRGWVFIGLFSQKGMACKLEKAMSIRRWGTTGGLGQLALTGPQSEKKLDVHGTVEFHKLTSCFTVRCVEAKWLSILS